MAWKRTSAIKRYDRGTIFTFGKHKGLAVRYVLEQDPQYLMWVVKNVPEVDIDVDIIDEVEDTKSRDFPLDNFNLDWIEEIPY